jgi:uncharacterized RDD family membrane protein YckC
MPTYAGFWRRAIAATLDNLVWLFGVATILGWLPIDTAEISDTAAYVGVIVVFSAWFNYFAFCEWRWGQTIGKNTTGIEVRGAAAAGEAPDGRAEQISFAQASIRNLLRLIDFFAIGELMIVTTRRKQRLGDKAAKTVVVRRAAAPLATAEAQAERRERVV